MARSFTSIVAFLAHGSDQLIDVRSPAEFALDHVPGAINLPVLDNDERALVGTIYKQESPFKARKIGAALVARNAARHLEGPLSQHGGGWKPLVYCWRGGQRSGSFATILTSVGWRAETVVGGYQTWRRLVVDLLHGASLPHRLVVLDGNTGTGKTEILQRLAAKGAQVLDLEGIARHRGSIFGATGDAQPAQKSFESQLASVLSGFDLQRPILVEAESSRIGQVSIPPALWSAMVRAPRIELVASLAARSAFLARAYGDVVADTARLSAILNSMRMVQGRERIAHWQALAAARDTTELAAELITHHYDPRYAKSRGRHASPVATLTTDSLDDAAIDLLADQVGAAASL